MKPEASEGTSDEADVTALRPEDISVASMDDYRATPVPEVSVEYEPPRRSTVTPLRNALVELKERVIDDVRESGIPMRTIGFAVAGAASALALLWIGRRMTRARRPRAALPRPAARPSVARAVGRELGREVVSRVLLGAASVIGARVANDILLPALVQKLATGSWQVPAVEVVPEARRKRRSRKARTE